MCLPREAANASPREGLKLVKRGAFNTLPRVPFLPSGGHSAVDLPTASRASPGTGGASRHAAPLGQRHPRILEMVLDEADGHGTLARGRRHPLPDPLRTSPAPKTPGWRRERALPDPRRQPAPWRPWPRSPSAGPGGAVRRTLASPAQGRYVLVWLNSHRTPAGTYKAEIYGIAVKGHPGAWAGKASPEPGGLTGPISPGPCGPGSALSAGPHTARTCSSRPVPAPAPGWSGRQAGLSGSVMRLPPGAGNTVG